MPMPRLDADADAALKLANEIAHEFELEYVGTEHILLAILRHNGGLGPKILQAFKIDEARARAEIEKLMQRDKDDTWVFGRLPGSPHYKNVMALAIDEATHQSATTGHPPKRRNSRPRRSAASTCCCRCCAKRAAPGSGPSRIWASR